MTKLWLIALSAAVLAATGPAAAQAQDEQAEAQRAALNREQAELARRQVEENIAAQRAYEDAAQAREIRIQAQDREYSRILAEHRQAMNQWRADLAACERGERSRCAVLADPAQPKEPATR